MDKCELCFRNFGDKRVTRSAKLQPELLKCVNCGCVFCESCCEIPMDFSVPVTVKGKTHFETGNYCTIQCMRTHHPGFHFYLHRRHKSVESQKVKDEEPCVSDEGTSGYKNQVLYCQLCKRNEYKESEIDVCDTCDKCFCLKCVNGKAWQYECDENDLSYHHFCRQKCRDGWMERYTFPCDGGCIAVLSRRKQYYSKYWGNYLSPF